ncbi:MAG: VanW family protein [Anaeromyxobacter sp.]
MTASVRHAARALLPLGLRVALRRAPALLRSAFQPALPLLPPGGRATFGHVQAQRATPLRRAGTMYGEALQRGKEQNVARAAALLDGLVIGPFETFSWHRTVGAPLRLRGFAPGPEVRGGEVVAGVGGGACQVANLVCWLGLHAGLELVERHGHDVDLFPDHERTAPFGSGATVFFPTRDLRLLNPGPSPLLLTLEVRDGWLHGAARLTRDPGLRWELQEREHHFVREPDGVYRQNRLWIRTLRGDELVAEAEVAANRARVLYAVPGLG